jgi:hypothetical protein
MQAGDITGRDTTDLSLTMEPLKAESLETTLKLLEFRQKDIRLLNAMPKLTAYNTVEEFLQLASYGADRGGFYNEGELSDVEDSQYIRRSELIKYIQVTGELTMQSQMVRSYVDAMRKEVENKAMWVQRRANSALTKASADLVPQEWNSLYKQHASVGVGDGFLYSSLEDYYKDSVVYDLRGESLKQTHLEEASVIIDENYGNVSHCFAPPSVISALSQDYFERQRIMLNASQEGAYQGIVGTVAKAIATTMGDVSLEPDKFMKRDSTSGRQLSSNASSQKAPTAPTAGASPNVTSDSLSKFQAGEVGTVYYAVSAINRYGESALTLLDSSAVTLAVGSSVDLTFTASSSTIAPTAFRIYRTKVTSAGSATNETFYPLFDVSVADLSAGYDGGASGKVRDRGRFLPDTETAFVTEMVDDVLSFKQLAPISKLDLAVISMSRRIITFLFATPQLYTPKKFVKFINASKSLTS